MTNRPHPTHQFAELIESRQERGLPVLKDFYEIRRRQRAHDSQFGCYRACNTVMDSVLTTATRRMPAVGKRSVEGGAFIVRCGQTMQPESA